MIVNVTTRYSSPDFGLFDPSEFTTSSLEGRIDTSPADWAMPKCKLAAAGAEVVAGAAVTAGAAVVAGASLSVGLALGTEDGFAVGFAVGIAAGALAGLPFPAAAGVAVGFDAAVDAALVGAWVGFATTGVVTVFEAEHAAAIKLNKTSETSKKNLTGFRLAFMV